MKENDFVENWGTVQKNFRVIRPRDISPLADQIITLSLEPYLRKKPLKRLPIEGVSFASSMTVSFHIHEFLALESCHNPPLLLIGCKELQNQITFSLLQKWRSTTSWARNYGHSSCATLEDLNKMGNAKIANIHHNTLIHKTMNPLHLVHFVHASTQQTSTGQRSIKLILHSKNKTKKNRKQKTKKIGPIL